MKEFGKTRKRRKEEEREAEKEGKEDKERKRNEEKIVTPLHFKEALHKIRISAKISFLGKKWRQFLHLVLSHVPVLDPFFADQCGFKVKLNEFL